MISRQKVHVALGAVMIVSLALTIVTFPFVLIWFGQPIGNTAAKMADVSAAVFSVAFFAAFALATIEQRSRYRARRDNPELMREGGCQGPSEDPGSGTGSADHAVTTCQ